MLGGGATKHLGCVGGRSTNTNMSYFNLERSKDDGLIVVVGWPGQWAADFIRDVDRGLRIRAGQELTHFKLLPGEEVRTPLSVLQFWKGGDWIRAKRLAALDDRPQHPPARRQTARSRCCWPISAALMKKCTKPTEEAHFMWFNRYLEEKIKLDYWWMDAGWYQCDPVGWPQGRNLGSR